MRKEGCFFNGVQLLDKEELYMFHGWEDIITKNGKGLGGFNETCTID